MASEPHENSALELFHPDGFASAKRTFGAGPAAALSAGMHDGPAEIVLLAPSPAERRDPTWTEAAVDIAESVTENGIVVVPHAARRLRRALAERGLVATARLLHVPDIPRSRYVFPVGGTAAKFALRRLVPLSRTKRAAATVLLTARAPIFPQTTVLFRRRGARPLLEWLCGPEASCDSIVARSRNSSRATIVFAFGRGRSPDLVVKVGGRAVEEARAIEALGGSARLAGASVPEILEQQMLGVVPAVRQTAVSGSPASQLLRGSSSRAYELLHALARWLASWNDATAVRRVFEPTDAERFVLDPAREVASSLTDGDEYLSLLRRLCEDCVGMNVPFVPAHNDLTAANILLDGHSRLGVVDWEDADLQSLPLCDLAYAAADVVAAVNGYRDRPAAFTEAFGPSGGSTGVVWASLSEAADSLRLDPRFVQLCLHSCWLRHASNEAREAVPADSSRPFREILQLVATGRGV